MVHILVADLLIPAEDFKSTEGLVMKLAVISKKMQCKSKNSVATVRIQWNYIKIRLK
jgi:hypothetical protein